jgi:hypothetical protein
MSELLNHQFEYNLVYMIQYRVLLEQVEFHTFHEIYVDHSHYLRYRLHETPKEKGVRLRKEVKTFESC